MRVGIIAEGPADVAVLTNILKGALALEKVRPYLQKHGADVELLGLAGGVVRLRLRGVGHGCASPVTHAGGIPDAGAGKDIGCRGHLPPQRVICNAYTSLWQDNRRSFSRRSMQ